MLLVVDCNNFFVSCQRVADPSLNGVPCLVLSNNDGVVVARSAEVKALGIKMGQPFFQVRELCKAEGVRVFSGDFELYSRLSRRVMELLREYGTAMEVYSIDEAFIEVGELVGRCDLVEHARKLRAAVLEKVGIPVSVGIAPTKVLAKIANEWAKTQTSSGVFSLEEISTREKVLRELPVGEVWGIGHQSAERLKKIKVFSAWDLAKAPSSVIQKTLSVAGARIQLELKGTPCLNLHSTHEAAKSIQCTRSFGKPITHLDDLREAVASFTARGCEKLREDSQLAKRIGVYIRTSRFAKNTPQYSASESVELPSPSDDTRVFAKAAETLLEKIYREGYAYKKAGIFLAQFEPKGTQTAELFSPKENPKNAKLMKIYDSLVSNFGRDKIFFAASGTSRAWKGHSDHHGEGSSNIPMMEGKSAKTRDPNAPQIRFVSGA